MWHCIWCNYCTGVMLCTVGHTIPSSCSKQQCLSFFRVLVHPLSNWSSWSCKSPGKFYTHLFSCWIIYLTSEILEILRFSSGFPSLGWNCASFCLRVVQDGVHDFLDYLMSVSSHYYSYSKLTIVNFLSNFSKIIINNQNSYNQDLSFKYRYSE